MRISRKILITLSVAAICVVVALYFAFDPGKSLWAPKCIFHVTTGWECPGCGSQRMLHALLHGDFAAAWEANPFILCLSPVLILMLLAAAMRERWPRLYIAVNSLPVIILISVGIIAWTLLRNLL